MSADIKINQIKPISEIKQVYSGRKGCACGCRGIYYTDKRNIKRIYNLFIKNIDKVYSYVDCVDKFVYFDEPHDRTYTIYYSV